MIIQRSLCFLSIITTLQLSAAQAQKPTAHTASAIVMAAQTKPYIQVTISKAGGVQAIGLDHESGKFFEVEVNQFLRKQRAFQKGLELQAQGKREYIFRLNPNDDFEFPADASAKEEAEVGSLAERLAKLTVAILAADGKDAKAVKEKPKAVASGTATAAQVSPALPLSPWAESQVAQGNEHLFLDAQGTK